MRRILCCHLLKKFPGLFSAYPGQNVTGHFFVIALLRIGQFQQNLFIFRTITQRMDQRAPHLLFRSRKLGQIKIVGLPSGYGFHNLNAANHILLSLGIKAPLQQVQNTPCRCRILTPLLRQPFGHRFRQLRICGAQGLHHGCPHTIIPEKLRLLLMLLKHIAVPSAAGIFQRIQQHGKHGIGCIDHKGIRVFVSRLLLGKGQGLSRRCHGSLRTQHGIRQCQRIQQHSRPVLTILHQNLSRKLHDPGKHRRSLLQRNHGLHRPSQTEILSRQPCAGHGSRP